MAHLAAKTVLLIELLSVMVWQTGLRAETRICDASAFRTEIAAAAAALQSAHEVNSKIFQEKLQALRKQNGWSEADYIRNAAPYLKDDTTEAADAIDRDLRAQLTALSGNTGSPSRETCTVFDDVRTLTSQLVSNADRKWRYMLNKLSKAIAMAPSQTH